MVKGVLRDVLGTFVDLGPEATDESAPAAAANGAAPAATPAGTAVPPAGQATRPATPPASGTQGGTLGGSRGGTPAAAQAPPGPPPEPAGNTTGSSDEVVDPAVERQVDEALAKLAPQQLIEFLALYDEMAFIANPADRARAVLVARGLSAAALVDLFAPSLVAVGKIQASFANTLGTRAAQADALAQARIDEADTGIKAAGEQIAALEKQIAELEETKVAALAAREAAKAEGAALQRSLERACERRRARFTEVQNVLADYGRATAKPPG